MLSRTEGTGPTPPKHDTVRVNYEGTLPDGTVFDSSIQRGQPAELRARPRDLLLDGDRADDEGGRKVKVICPPGLAYGPRAAGHPAELAVIFDIHLLGIGEATASPGSEAIKRDHSISRSR